jgi:hypothetical protein
MSPVYFGLAGAQNVLRVRCTSPQPLPYNHGMFLASQSELLRGAVGYMVTREAAEKLEASFTEDDAGIASQYTMDMVVAASLVVTEISFGARLPRKQRVALVD